MTNPTNVQLALGQAQQLGLARPDAEILLAEILQASRAQLFAFPERALSLPQQLQVEQWFTRRQSGEPVAYILGYREFFGLRFAVNQHVLIPRPETELLVETALRLCAKTDARVLDLGTGSGAIACALKLERPNWRVHAVDFSIAALNVAQQNAEALKLDIAFLQSDWFAACPGAGWSDFDLIVANPPYIDPDDPHLRQGDLPFEPITALQAIENGLYDIRKIASQASGFLRSMPKNAAWLMFEHGFEQGPAGRQILRENSFQDIETIKDLAGLERLTLGRRAG